jgi:hypothetical protein
MVSTALLGIYKQKFWKITQGAMKASKDLAHSIKKMGDILLTLVKLKWK